MPETAVQIRDLSPDGVAISGTHSKTATVRQSACPSCHCGCRPPAHCGAHCLEPSCLEANRRLNLPTVASNFCIFRASLYCTDHVAGASGGARITSPTKTETSPWRPRCRRRPGCSSKPNHNRKVAWSNRMVYSLSYQQIPKMKNKCLCHTTPTRQRNIRRLWGCETAASQRRNAVFCRVSSAPEVRRRRTVHVRVHVTVYT